MAMTPPREDLPDLHRRRYLEAVLERMGRSPAEESHIREKARDLLSRKRLACLAGDAHLDRWAQLLDLPLDRLAAVLLSDGPEGREMRHSHMFAGALPAREIDQLRRRTSEEAVDPSARLGALCNMPYSTSSQS